MLNGELLFTKILEVNLIANANKLPSRIYVYIEITYTKLHMMISSLVALLRQMQAGGQYCNTMGGRGAVPA